ncbi:uncharacterized mitochondrial protein AtMg00810-like [Lathyrus oleraceus]|uniref:uncharacterized mitochondrial protein AtMg00810-like n=1 Tax=Pisum sativum TaxID=3888 RepID=UPI0021D2ECBB|nr:uncharacterized mitochondrial protein AtMg00810-like [Pisum sativum]
MVSTSKAKKGRISFIIFLYMDDLLVVGSCETKTEQFKDKMKQVFEMTDLGKVAYFLGMELLSTSCGMILHQSKFAKEILTKFNMLECNIVVTQAETNLKLVSSDEGEEDEVDATILRQLVGSLRYLCLSRPNISYGVGLVNRFMSNPIKQHFNSRKKIMKDVNGTLYYGLVFLQDKGNNILKLTSFLC